MLKREYGRIINISSIAGLHAAVHGPHYAAYAASKAGLMGLTRELAASWGRHNIRVNAIAPGFFHSRLADPVLPLVEPAIKASCPIPRIGAEGELKGVCVFLASDASNYITGQTIVVDGGRTIGELLRLRQRSRRSVVQRRSWLAGIQPVCCRLRRQSRRAAVRSLGICAGCPSGATTDSLANGRLSN